MFMKGDFIRFLYKVWCLCGSDVFPQYLSIYNGKSQDTGKPLRSHVANAMADFVEDYSRL